MPRIVFTVTDEMQEDLAAVAKSKGSPVAELIRRYIAGGLAADMEKKDRNYDVLIGGNRTKKADEA